MIHPYWSILKDSFREALASRVLWILMILITIALAAVAPFHITSVFSSDLTSDDLVDPKAFVKALVSAGDAPAGEVNPEAPAEGEAAPAEATVPAARPGPVSRVWSLLSSNELRDSLRGFESLSSQKQAETLRSLRDDINKQLNRRDFHDPDFWPTPPSETSTAGELLKKGVDKLSASELRQMNRRLFEAEFKGLVRRAPDRSSQVRYAVWDIGRSSPRQMLEMIVKGVLLGVLSFVVGTIGVFVGILVTSGIVPTTFEPGSVDLLFSKPISRSLVYLTKVLGGSIFIAICSVYFTGGLWLIMGVQFGIWMHNLWMCVPVYQFLFLVYYSVSSLTGVIWRSPIVSVMVTIFFWIVCTTVGTVKAVFDTVILDPTRIVHMTSVNGTPLVVQSSGETREWIAESSDWVEISKSESQRGRRGPFSEVATLGLGYLPRKGYLVQLEQPRGGPGSSGVERLVIGRRMPEWKRIDSASPPRGAVSLFTTRDENLLVVSTSGLFAFKGVLWKEKAETPKLFEWIKIPFGESKAGAFEKVGPENTDDWERPISAAFDSATEQVVVQTGNMLRVLKPDANGKYVETATLELEESRRSLVGIGAGRVTLADETGRVRVFGAEKLDILKDLTPFGDGAPLFVAADSDAGWVAVLSSSRRLWLHNTVQDRNRSSSISGQGDISAVEFLGDGGMLVADRYRRVSQYELPPTADAAVKLVARFEPAPTMQERIYWYAVKPIHTVFPKPSELENLVSYLIMDSNDPMAQMQRDLREQRQTLDVWQPVYSCTGFLVFVLLCGCAYVARRDF